MTRYLKMKTAFTFILLCLISCAAACRLKTLIDGYAKDKQGKVIYEYAVDFGNKIALVYYGKVGYYRHVAIIDYRLHQFNLIDRWTNKCTTTDIPISLKLPAVNPETDTLEESSKISDGNTLYKFTKGIQKVQLTGNKDGVCIEASGDFINSKADKPLAASYTIETDAVERFLGYYQEMMEYRAHCTYNG